MCRVRTLAGWDAGAAPLKHHSHPMRHWGTPLLPTETQRVSEAQSQSSAVAGAVLRERQREKELDVTGLCVAEAQAGHRSHKNRMAVLGRPLVQATKSHSW